MTDTLRSSEPVTTPEVGPDRQLRNTRNAVVILVILVLAAGAWIVYDFVQESTLAPTAEISQLIDDYNAAWNDYDGEAFLATTREGYDFTSNVSGTFDRDEQLAVITTDLPAFAWRVEMLEDPVMVGDGPWYYVSFPVEIETNLSGTSQGVSLITVFDTGGGEYLVIDHIHSGR